MDTGREKMLLSLYFWSFRGALFPVRLLCRYPESRFLPFCPEFFLMGSVMQNLLPENFAVIRCLVFCLFVVCAAVVLRYLVVGFLLLALVLFASCSVYAVRFSVACVPLAALLFSLLFSSSRLSLLGVGRGGGLFPCSASPLGLLRSRCRRCRQELAHDSTPSFPPFLLLTVLPPFPPRRGRPPLLPAVSFSFFSFSFLSLSFLFSLLFSFAVVLAMLCVAIGYWLLILDSISCACLDGWFLVCCHCCPCLWLSLSLALSLSRSLSLSFSLFFSRLSLSLSLSLPEPPCHTDCIRVQWGSSTPSPPPSVYSKAALLDYLILSYLGGSTSELFPGVSKPSPEHPLK